MSPETVRLPDQGEPRHFHPTHPTQTTNDFTKSVYLNLLAEFPEADVVGFFADHPMRWEGRRLGTAELLQRLWLDKAKVPLAWDYEITDSLDRFLADRGWALPDFYSRLLYRNNRSTYVPGRFLLKWFYPVMKAVFNSLDPRDMVIRLIPHFTENLLPHHIHRRVVKTVEGNWTESTLVFITDDRFRETIHFDSGVNSCEQIKACPGILDLPAFEEVTLICETRTIESAVWSATVEERDGVVTVNGCRIGRRIDFGEFCRSRGIDLSEYRVPESSCVLIEVGYDCPQRKRIVLQAGSVYGAPVCLHRIRHDNTRGFSKDILDHMVSDEDNEESAPLATLVGPKHEAAQALAREKVSCKWFGNDESITLNGEHLVKGVPALILRRVLREYNSRGRVVFEYREFKRDEEIGFGPKNANFEVRLYRLMEKLSEKAPGIVIEKQGRGKFGLRIQVTLDYSEE